MKRILFYLILFSQIVMITILALQYSFVDLYGDEITLAVVKNDHYYFNEEQRYYLDYTINSIPKEKWEMKKDLTFNEGVYVLLEQGSDQLYHVKQASTSKLKANEKQIVLRGKYRGDIGQSHSVSYGIERINKGEHLTGIQSREKAVAIVKRAPWGQMKVVAIEKASDLLK